MIRNLNGPAKAGSFFVVCLVYMENNSDEKIGQHLIGKHHYTVLRKEKEVSDAVQEMSDEALYIGKLTIEQGRKLFEGIWGGGVPDALSFIPRRILPRAETGSMKQGGKDDYDIHGNAADSNMGLVAIRTLNKYFGDATLITNSYVKAIPEKNWPEERHAEVARAQLIKFGIPEYKDDAHMEEKIISQDRSFSTLTELLENIRIFVENYEKYGWKHLVLIAHGTQTTSGTKIGRIPAMIKMIDTVRDPADYRNTRDRIQDALQKFHALESAGKIKLSVISYEDVVERISKRHAMKVAEVKNSEKWMKTRSNDDDAAEAILKGTYGQKRPEGSNTIIQ